MQIVEQESPPVNNEVPEDAKFLGKHNQKVQQETRSEKSGSFSNAGSAGQKTTKTPQNPRQPKPVSRKLVGNLPSLAQLKPQFNFTPKAENIVVEKSGDASQTSDHLNDTEKRLQTLMSTREFLYYSYYQRIREKIRQKWEPLIKQKVKKVFASGRTIASARDRVTQIVITLNKEGSLLRVQVIGESGIHDLDEAAVEAFKQAEPFPNPPRGIIESDGTIKIRWDFVLEASYTPHIEGQYAELNM